MERLAALSKELGTPGLEKLFKGAKSRNIPVSRQQIKEFLATKGEAQVFRPLPRSAGKSASEGPGTRFQMDLIDMSNSPSNGMSYILALVDVFTRQLWAAGVTSKTPGRVANALRPMLNALPRMPDVILVIRAWNSWAPSQNFCRKKASCTRHATANMMSTHLE